MSNPIIDVQGICKAFPSPSGDISVLKGIDLSVVTGESVSVRGDSGTGKTTLLNIIAALESADVGEIYWKGENIKSKSSSWLAKKRGSFLGLVFQSYYLIPELTALDNVIIAARLVGNVNANDRKRAKDLLERVGLGERLKQVPAKLSGGERQRVALARALINKPELILADEPTGNLDENTGDEVMNILLNLCEEEEVSLVLVTHNLDYAKRTSRQVILSHGVI